MSHFRRAIATLVAAAALVSGGVAVATSAEAASFSPVCNHDGWSQPEVPEYVSGSTRVLGCYLYSGTTGEGVWDLQFALKECYGRNIATDGVFGPLTQAALKYAQAKAGVTADGVYGPQTRNALLFAELGNGTNTSVYCVRARLKA